MNLQSLALEPTYTFPLKHPVEGTELYDGDKPVTITVYGRASKQYRNYVTAMQNRELQRKRRKDNTKAEDLREEAVKLLVAVTKSMEGVEIDSKVYKTPEDFYELYSNEAFSWIKDQVDEALGDDANFLKK